VTVLNAATAERVRPMGAIDAVSWSSDAAYPESFATSTRRL
jgi:hypothetical protein